MLNGFTCIYRNSVDLFFYVLGSSNENAVSFHNDLVQDLLIASNFVFLLCNMIVVDKQHNELPIRIVIYDFEKKCRKEKSSG